MRFSPWTMLSVALVAGLLSCSSETLPPFALEAVTPASVLEGTTTEINISGTFPLASRVDFRRRAASPVSDEFAVSLAGRALAGVLRLDGETLTAQVPDTFPVGMHSMQVVSPDGRTATLEDAFEVFPIADCPRDADEDGHVDAVCPGGTDCNDAVAACTTDCSDSDANGLADCEECPRDLDDDGQVDVACPGGTDCDDAVAACTTDCSDSDGNGVADCAECPRDDDEDGFVNLLCPGGDDCDDTLAACNVDCSDLDGNGVPDCAGTCIDRDGDGLGDGTLDNVGCIDPTTDSIDTVDWTCADTDGDGCDDCRSGQWRPAEDGWDGDADGACDSPLLRVISAEVSFNSAQTSQSVSLSPAVDPDRSLVIASARSGMTSEANGNGPSDASLTVRLTPDGSSVEVERLTARNLGVTARVHIVELQGAAVQHGTATLPADRSAGAPTVVTLGQAVDPLRTLVLATSRTVGDRFDSSDWVAATLAGATRLELEADPGGDEVIVEWQVADLSATGAIVQRGIADLPAGSGTIEVGLPAPAPMGRSFLLFSHSQSGSGTPSISEHSMAGWMMDSRTVELMRQQSTVAARAPWQVVTWDALEVRQGRAELGVGAKDHAVTLDPAAVPERSFGLLTSLMREGASDGTMDSAADAWMTLRLTDTGDGFRARRDGDAGRLELGWVVAEFR